MVVRLYVSSAVPGRNSCVTTRVFSFSVYYVSPRLLSEEAALRNEKEKGKKNKLRVVYITTEMYSFRLRKYVLYMYICGFFFIYFYFLFYDP